MSDDIVEGSVVEGSVVEETPSEPVQRESVVALTLREENGALVIDESSLLEAFAEFMGTDVANGDATEATIKAYYGEVRQFLQWCRNNELEPARVTRRNIEAYRAYLKQSGASVATRSHKLTIVRRFYESALKHDLIRRNPAHNVKGGKDLTAPEEKIKALSEDALRKLFASIPKEKVDDDGQVVPDLDGLRARAIIGLQSLQNLRRAEGRDLNYSNLMELDSKYAHIKVIGKGRSVRTAPLRPDTKRALLAYIDAKVAAGYSREGAIFVAHGNRSRGQRLSVRAFNRIVDKYLSAANLKRPGVSNHALRHTYGTLSYAGGANLVAIQNAMGHKSHDTTLIYVKLHDLFKNNPANFIDVNMDEGEDYFP